MRIPSSTESIQNYVQNISAVIATILNLFLIFLIIRKSPVLIGPYKYLMVYISVNEILYALVAVLVSPIIHHTGYTFLVISRLDNFNFSPLLQLALTGLYCGLFGCSMAIFGIHFIYRYLVIKGSSLISTFRTWKALLWLSIPLIYGITWGSIAVFCCGPRDITDTIIGPDILEKLDLKVDDVIYIGPNLRDENGNIYWPTAIGLVVDCFIMISSFFTVTYFCWKCFEELSVFSSRNHISSKMKNLQHQLYFALVSQTLIPVILLQLPTFALFLTVFFPVDIGECSGLVSIAIAIYPAIDPLPTMFIVTSYRNAIFGYVNWIGKAIGRLFIKNKEERRAVKSEQESKT